MGHPHLGDQTRQLKAGLRAATSFQSAAAKWLLLPPANYTSWKRHEPGLTWKRHHQSCRPPPPLISGSTSKYRPRLIWGGRARRTTRWGRWPCGRGVQGNCTFANPAGCL